MSHLVRSIFLLFVLLITGIAPMFGQAKPIADQYEAMLLPGEQWWGGLSHDAGKMPYTSQTKLSRDMWGNNDENQAQPLLISSRGRYVWCDDPIKYSFNAGKLTVSSRTGAVKHGQVGRDLTSAYRYVSKTFFPPNGQLPDPALFALPQYNTWIELKYEQQEDKILAYAQQIIDNGYPPGVLMIDDTWQANYGTWEFSAGRFKDPKGMITKLHAMGFRVMLWICPFVSPDSENFRELARKGLVLVRNQHDNPVDWSKDTQDKAAIVHWWNGYSGVLDLTNPDARTWFNDRLDHLVNEYGVDGFKFDAGDARYYADSVVSRNLTTPNDHTKLFGEIGLRYPLNEYRASFKMAGTQLVQRLADKDHSWSDLRQLIPGILAQGLMGYAFTCPDMIGGGQWLAFADESRLDRELIVRSAQIHALMPMMQFSVAPWRILTPEQNAICLKSAKLHQQFGPRIVELARQSAKTGEPIARSMGYNYPAADYGTITDQFMLGPDVLVAPVVQKGGRSRAVTFPAGTWVGDDGSTVIGPAVKIIAVPLDRLPYFTRSR